MTTIAAQKATENQIINRVYVDCLLEMQSNKVPYTKKSNASRRFFALHPEAEDFVDWCFIVADAIEDISDDAVRKVYNRCMHKRLDRSLCNECLQYFCFEIDTLLFTGYC